VVREGGGGGGRGALACARRQRWAAGAILPVPPLTAGTACLRLAAAGCRRQPTRPGTPARVPRRHALERLRPQPTRRRLCHRFRQVAALRRGPAGARLRMCHGGRGLGNTRAWQVAGMCVQTAGDGQPSSRRRSACGGVRTQMPVIDEYEQHCAAAAALYRGSSMRRSQPARVPHRLPTLRSRQRAGAALDDKLHGPGGLVGARPPQHRQHQLLVVGNGEQAIRDCVWGAQPSEKSKQVISKSVPSGGRAGRVATISVRCREREAAMRTRLRCHRG
jgi:hypothetical protein